MKILFSKPQSYQLDKFLSSVSNIAFSYNKLGATKLSVPIKGYDNDYNEIKIGNGLQDFDNAKKAMQKWVMFPSKWTFIHPENAPIVEGTTVAMCAKVMGIWWLNSCKIVYVIDEPTRFGFAYGTLKEHVETGEELFLLTLRANGEVWYSLKAFSKPRFWMVRLTYPLSRNFQKQFIKDSKQAMLNFIHHV